MFGDRGGLATKRDNHPRDIAISQSTRRLEHAEDQLDYERPSSGSQPSAQPEHYIELPWRWLR